MDIRQIEALLAVAEFGSFSGAAEALHTVQSNISTRLAKLESELGVELVDRRSRLLTTHGEVVASRARNVLAELRAIPSDLAAMKDEVIGEVHLGVIGSTARWLVPQVLRRVTSDLPMVTLGITEAPTSTILSLVASGGLDVGIVSLPADRPGVEAEPMFEEDVLLVVPNEHPLASKQSVLPTELDGVPLILPPQQTPFRDELDFEFARNGVTLTPATEVDGIRLIESLVSRGIDAGLLPATATPADGVVSGIPIVGIGHRTVGIVLPSRSPRSVPVRAVTDVIHNVVEKGIAELQGVYAPNADA